MNCAKCSTPTKVTSTRQTHTVARAFSRVEAEAKKSVEWYTPEWTIRTRRCHICKTVATTIEVYTEDMGGMIKSAMKGEGPC